MAESDFAGVEAAQPGAERLPKLSAGDYLLEVVANKTITVKGGKKVILREFKVKEAIGEGATPVGTEAAAKLLYFSDEWFHARLAEYVRGLTGSPKVDASLCDKIFGPENPTAGKLIKVRVHSEKSDGGKDYLKYDFRYVPDDDTKTKKSAKA